MPEVRMPRKMAEEIYDLLTILAGASSGMKQDFVHSQRDSEYFVNEYRFQGSLGFGGKFWVTRNNMYVNCYPEDETDKILEIIEVVNRALKILMDRHGYHGFAG